jgi:hypothetical protein
MNDWKRITLVTFALIGGVTLFGYWSLNQFDNVFDNLGAAYITNTAPVSLSLKTDSEALATSTATSTDMGTDLELAFTFPQSGDRVYYGCTYPISWQSSTTINSLGTTLIDAGTGESAGPIASGLAKENAIEKDLQNLNWKVGNVWPGDYYIRVSKINGIETEFKSKVFEINRIPEEIDASEQESICKESGGSL